jgi:hypothetical protein
VRAAGAPCGLRRMERWGGQLALIWMVVTLG